MPGTRASWARPTPVAQHQRFAHHLLPVAVHHHGPFLRGLVVGGAPGLAARPVVQLHDLGVHLQPVADLVFGREDRPVVGEGQVGQMIVPDRVVQAERAVALAPRVAGAVVLLDDDGCTPAAWATRPADAALPAGSHGVGCLCSQRGFFFCLRSSQFLRSLKAPCCALGRVILWPLQPFSSTMVSSVQHFALQAMWPRPRRRRFKVNQPARLRRYGLAIDLPAAARSPPALRPACRGSRPCPPPF